MTLTRSIEQIYLELDSHSFDVVSDDDDDDDAGLCVSHSLTNTAPIGVECTIERIGKEREQEWPGKVGCQMNLTDRVLSRHDTDSE